MEILSVIYLMSKDLKKSLKLGLWGALEWGVLLELEPAIQWGCSSLTSKSSAVNVITVFII